MARYSIKDLEKLSGIKAHTIRIWEKRYGVLEPYRTSTNIRFYSDDQLKHLLNVALLVNNGGKISEIGSLQKSEIHERISELSTTGDLDYSIDEKMNGLIVSMIDLDEPKFERIFASAIVKFGFEKTITDLIYPFLERIGLMWGTEQITPGHEHFISNLIRQKLIIASDTGNISDPGANKYILFLPEGEHHELGLLFSNYLIRKEGNDTLYLGQNVPFPDLISIRKVYKPDYALCIFTVSQPAKTIQKLIDDLGQKFKSKKVIILGSESLLGELEFPSNAIKITSVPEFLQFLR